MQVVSNSWLGDPLEFLVHSIEADCNSDVIWISGKFIKQKNIYSIILTRTKTSQKVCIFPQAFDENNYHDNIIDGESHSLELVSAAKCT
jgi:hypothetical protein